MTREEQQQKDRVRLQRGMVGCCLSPAEIAKVVEEEVQNLQIERDAEAENADLSEIGL